MVEKGKILSKIPGFSQGIRDNASVRMVKMMQPICPFSQFEIDVTPEGKLVPRREPRPDRQNCQKRGRGWWDYCVEQGHDPYFRTRVWYSKKDLFEEQDGEQVKTGERTVRHEEKRPNIAQVAAHVRVNSGRGPALSYRNKGFRTLEDFGYAPVCEYRNCQNEVKVTSRMGGYCSMYHAALIGADGAQEFLTQTAAPLNQGGEDKVAIKRQKQLQEAAALIQAQEIR